MIYVLGGLGFVGSAFVRWCQKNGREHQVIDVHNYAQFKGSKCDVFVNANGNSKKPLAVKEPLNEFDLSVRSVRSTLVDFGCDLYVHLSTCDVYPDCTTPATTVESMTFAPHEQSPYGFHKHLAEQIVRHGARRFMVARMGGFVGPGLKKNAIYDIVNGGPLWLDPASELQFMHSDDCARIIMQVAESGAVKNDVVNVCGKGVVRLADVMAWAGKRVAVQPNSPKVRYEVSIEKIEGITGVPMTADTVKAFVTSAAAHLS